MTIKEVIVADSEGQAIYSQRFGTHPVDEQSLAYSSLISAVHSFGKMLSPHDVNEIKLGEICLLIHSANELLFAVVVDNGNRESNEEKLKSIADLFLENYAAQIAPSQQTLSENLANEFTGMLVQHNFVTN
ncbi:hypothetical protein EU537_07280 [Candidatus Thorarchaeota archaeon]|nr:MAG: hypothetical protein EU537_07280 [Candidatus Thorarchaeota archaeon]